MKLLLSLIVLWGGKLSAADPSLLGNTLSSIALVLVGIVITIFVLTVTLLGKAARVAKEGKTEAEQKSAQEFDKDIENLRKRLTSKPHDIDGLKKEIEDLETKKSYTAGVIGDLDRKYNALGLTESVLFPGGSFLTTIVLADWITLISSGIVWEWIIFILAALSLGYGINRILISLQSVQYFSLNIKEDQREQLQSALIEALKTVEADKKPNPVIKIKGKPPLIFKANSEGKISFEIDLKSPGNNEAKNIDAWFLISPEIEIIESTIYGKSFKQNPNYSIPNANTVRYKFGLVRMHEVYRGDVKIRTTIPGKFKMRYKVNCDGHAEPSDKEIGIIVEE